MITTVSDFEISPPLQLALWKDLPAPLRLYMRLCLLLDTALALALPYYHIRYHAATRIDIWSVPKDRFGDFWHYRQLFSNFHTLAFFTNVDRFAYPAPCAAVLNILYHAGPYPHGVFCLILLAVMLASASFFYRMLVLHGFLTLDALALTFFLIIFSSYPWEKLFDRSNIELFVYIFLATGLWAYLTGRRSLAAALWGCAGAMKIYPLVMMAVFFHRKSLRPLLVGFATFAAVLLASFWYVGPTIAIAAHGSLAGITGFLGNYAASAHLGELNIDHSILGATKSLLQLDRWHVGNDWSRLSTGYQVLVAIGGPILYFAWIRKLPVWNQLCLFLVAIVVLPPVSYDYTLIHIYPVIGIVVAAYLYASRRGQVFPKTSLFFILFAVLTTTQGWVQTPWLHFNGIIKCAALLTLSWLLLRIPLTLGPSSDAKAAV